MRMLLPVLVTLIATLISACPIQPVENEATGLGPAPAAGDRVPVLVELFTSEGCSSCPPADRTLAFLETQQPVSGAEIITVAFHVDYWDRLGWKDRFSSPLFTQRQVNYTQVFKLDSAYTPQMVVDGRAEFVGSDSGKASNAISKAAEQPKAAIEISRDTSGLRVKIANAPKHGDATVYAAIAEDGISTRVERGENSGKTLEHVSVVRDLTAIGVLPAGDESFEGALELKVPDNSKNENLKVVVFVQENVSRKIVGVGRIKF